MPGLDEVGIEPRLRSWTIGVRMVTLSVRQLCLRISAGQKLYEAMELVQTSARHVRGLTRFIFSSREAL